jgi:hypothetical protein
MPLLSSDVLRALIRATVADQNHYIYKPMLCTMSTMSTMQPGMTIVLPKAPNATTFSALVLVAEVNYRYPNFAPCA